VRTRNTPVPDRNVDAALRQQRRQVAGLIRKQRPTAHLHVVEAAPDQLIGRAFRIIAPVAHD
jgi:hypothetical protein